MITTTLILILLLICWKYLKDYINFFKTGDPRETDRSYWMFSYDHKSTKKEDFKESVIDYKTKKNEPSLNMDLKITGR